ncbi:MAG: hypothetical protein WDA21_00285 [Bacilli bacterium]
MLRIAKETGNNDYYLFNPEEGYILTLQDNRETVGDLYFSFKRFERKEPVVINKNDEFKIIVNHSEPLFSFIDKLFDSSTKSKNNNYFDSKNNTLTHFDENEIRDLANIFKIQKTKNNISITYIKKNDTPFHDSIRIICLRGSKDNPGLAYALCDLIDNIKAFKDTALVTDSYREMMKLMLNEEKTSEMIYE